MDTGDAPVGRATELVGAAVTNFSAATDDRTAKLKCIKAGKVFGGWACYASTAAQTGPRNSPQ